MESGRIIRPACRPWCHQGFALRTTFPFCLNASKLPVMAAAFLLCAYNVAFWKAFIGATGGWHLATLPVQFGMLLMLVCALTACLALVNFRHVIKPVLILLVLVTSVASYFMTHYGTAIDWSMVQNVMETDRRESTELLSAGMLATLALTGVLPAVVIATTRITFRPVRRQLAFNLGTAGAALVGAAMLLVVLFKALAPALHDHRELRFLLTPTNVIQAVSGYYKRKWHAKLAIAPLGTDAAKGVLWAGSRRRTVTVLVVGETARASNFSLNGYPRLTNPQLTSVPDLLNFRHMESCGTATAVSVP